MTEPYNDGKEDGLEDVASLQTESYDKISRQIIYYGAPGTGKSHKIKEILGEYEGCPADKKFPKQIFLELLFIRTVIIQLLSGHTSRQWKSQLIKYMPRESSLAN